MKVIIAGSRTITDYEFIKECIRSSGWEITAVVSGRAAGVDLLGERWAKENGVPVIPFPVTRTDYKLYGRHIAPKIRNTRMSIIADGLIALWNGESRGTKDMIDKMTSAGKPRKIYIPGKGQM